MVSARGQTRSRTALLLPSVTQRSAETAALTRSRNTESGAVLNCGPKYSASSSMCGTPSSAASSRANVVFPEPVRPSTKIRQRPEILCAEDGCPDRSDAVLTDKAYSFDGL